MIKSLYRLLLLSAATTSLAAGAYSFKHDAKAEEQIYIAEASRDIWTVSAVKEEENEEKDLSNDKEKALIWTVMGVMSTLTCVVVGGRVVSIKAEQNKRMKRFQHIETKEDINPEPVDEVIEKSDENNMDSFNC